LLRCYDRFDLFFLPVLGEMLWPPRPLLHPRSCWDATTDSHPEQWPTLWPALPTYAPGCGPPMRSWSSAASLGLVTGA